MTCYRRPKDAGVPGAGDDVGDASPGDAERAGDEVDPDTETDTDTVSAGGANRADGAMTSATSTDGGQQIADPRPPVPDASDQRTDAGPQEADAGITTSGDAAASCTPSAEVCDGKDNDCDGRIDEETPTWYCDDDGDGFAANATGKVESCEKPAASAACSDWTTTAPSGPNERDCDDTTTLRFPGAGFGLAPGPNGDLNCDGETETRFEFVSTSVPGYYSSTTTFNVCQHPFGDVLGGTAEGECNCWFSTAIDYASFSGAYFMPTFPCAERVEDVIWLSRAAMFTECQQDVGNVIVRQVCR